MKTLCIDFDGVIHSYASGWKGVEVITDPPVDGAFEWLRGLQEAGFQTCIYSSRSKDPRGLEAMRAWFGATGCPKEVFDRLEFPTQKPAAMLTIDDRAICFDGTFPTVAAIEAFRPWNRR